MLCSDAISDQALLEAFRRAARRGVSVASDAAKVRDVLGQFSAMPQGDVDTIVDLKHVTASLVLKIPPPPVLQTSLQGRQWLLSVCVPRAVKRRMPLRQKSEIPGVLAGISALPDHMKDVAKLTVERIIHLWSNSPISAHRELLTKIVSSPPRILASVSPVLGAWFTKNASGSSGPWHITARRILRLMLKLKDADITPWLPGLLGEALRARTSENLDILIETSDELRARGFSDVSDHVESILRESFPGFIASSIQ